MDANWNSSKKFVSISRIMARLNIAHGLEQLLLDKEIGVAIWIGYYFFFGDAFT
jgi:hypothetical protein